MPTPGVLFGLSEQESQTVSAVICEAYKRHADLLKKEGPFVLEEKRLYLRKQWDAETACFGQLQRLLTSTPSIGFDQAAVEEYLTRQKESLQPEQSSAILRSFLHPLTFITGGPGTGKTYTAGQLIAAMWHFLSPKQQASFRVILAAPTGKAAANLEASVARVLQGKSCPTPVAQTVHSLLKLRGELAPPLAIVADLLIIDESSMLDAQLMAQLLSAVKRGSRVVFLGDADQLPAVEAGGLFADFIETPSLQVVVSRLRACLRTDSQQILACAQAIQRGDAAQFLHLLNERKDSVSRLKIKTPEQLIEYVLTAHTSREQDSSKLLQHYNRFRLLSPLLKGPFGVEVINEKMHRESRRRGIEAIPIMVTRNAPHLSLVNGDVGVLIRDRAYFPTQGVVEAWRLPPHALAYCLSIHKSQGSEFEHVLLLLPEGSDHFGRALLYTAVTRAKRQLEVWGEDALLKQMIAHAPRRYAGLQDRLREIAPMT